MVIMWINIKKLNLTWQKKKKKNKAKIKRNILSTRGFYFYLNKFEHNFSLNRNTSETGCFVLSWL